MNGRCSELAVLGRPLPDRLIYVRFDCGEQEARGVAPIGEGAFRQLEYPTVPVDVVAAVRASLPPGTVVDGELVVWDPATGSTVFPALLGRITAGRRVAREALARPANLVLFDVLAAAGENLTGQSLRHRRARLEHLLIDAPSALALCPQTSDIALARIWFDELSVTGSEGLVVKDLDGVYRAGGRGSTWWKYKSVRVTSSLTLLS